jgi:hypothetical protein
MSIDSLYADSIDASIAEQLRNPGPAPETSFSTWSFIKSGVKGPAAAANETTGTLADALSAFGQTMAATDARPSMFGSQTAEQRTQEEEARKKMLAGYVDTTVGNSFRAVAAEFAPDPQTAHAADQAIFGLTRFATKATIDVGLLGPGFGAAALGLDEGNTTTQNLINKGVDTSAAMKVGGITGVTSGVGAVLPIGGKTVTQTLGLIGLGGPGSFIAQEALSREILQQNYPGEASTHDPLDPLGLTLSIAVPGAFGALHLRGARGRARAIDAGGVKLEQMSTAERQKLRYDAPQLDAYAVQAAERNGIPPQILLAVKNAGEKSNPTAQSPKGAKGVMQFMDATWKEFGVGDPRDPLNSIDAGAKYLRKLYDSYGSWDAAIAHYNGGGAQAALVRGGARPSFKETAAYLDRVKAYVGKDVATTAAKTPELVDAARVRVLDDVVRESLPERPSAYQEVMRATDDVAAGIVHENLAPPAKVTELPEFKRWFADSKVVSDSGEPQVMYHGTAAEFNEFRPGRAGLVFVSPDPEFASSYAFSRADAMAGYPDTMDGLDNSVNGASVLPVWVRASNIFDATEKNYKEVESPQFIESLKAQGYDAMRIKESGVENIALFDPQQLKSAIGNSGKFDPNSRSLTDPLTPGESSPFDTYRPDLPRGTGDANALPEPSGSLAEQPSAAKAMEGEASPAARLVKSLADESPDTLVSLPETGEKLTLAKALEKIEEEAQMDAKEADIYRAAVECALINGT